MTIVIKDKGKTTERRKEFNPERLQAFMERGLKDLPIKEENKQEFMAKIRKNVERHKEIEAKEIRKIMIKKALVKVDDIKEPETNTVTPVTLNNTKWDNFARYVLQTEMYKRASRNRSYNANAKYGDYYGLVKMMTEKGLYDATILEAYTEHEIIEAGKQIDSSKDELYKFIGLKTMLDRYCVGDSDGSILELPQERLMTAALYISSAEKPEKRFKVAMDLYWCISNQYVTLATPTLTNAGTPYGSLSSCHIVTTEDSLRSIYDDNTDIATFSKNGSGIGTYIGKLRANGSDIRGKKGVSKGTIGWIKQLDNTAVSVDQLGQRAGAIAVYQDMWHKDVVALMDLRLNTGDPSKRAYNVFTGLCIPDEFMRQVNARGDWYLFDPHEIKNVMGFNLEDYFDQEKLRAGETPDKDRHAWTYRYYQCVDNPELSKVRVPAISLMAKAMKAELESGIPFKFYRDTVNRDNPNKHAGMIYSSNLCTEIAQNMSPSEVVEERMNYEEGTMIVYKKMGDLVTCNLSSLVLNNIIRDNVLEKVISIQVRALDNVISKLKVPVTQATYTNLRYRAIGSGEQGIAATLAIKGIHWDSQQAVDYVSKLEEKILMLTIKASSDLGKEKGSYPLFEGSEWNTGEWIDRKPTTLDGWEEVKAASMKYMRNAYLRAIAPTGSTSIIANSTASAEAIFDVIFMERKGDFQLPTVVPELNQKTWFFYKPTMKMNYKGDKQAGHMWAILQNAARQVWIDQATSHNFYVPQDILAPTLLDLHYQSWNRGVKTEYYVRQWDKKYEENCRSCGA